MTSRLQDHLFAPPTRGRAIFPGWYVVGFTFVMQFVAMGLVYYSFGVYLKPLAEALETSRFSISLTLSIEAIVVACVAPMIARLYAEVQIRRMLTLGTCALAFGLMSMSLIQETWQLYVVFGGGVALGLVSLTAIPSNLLLANWFDRRRGLAMGISQFGISISAAILVPVVTWLFLTLGWRTAFVVCGAAAGLVLVPMIWLFAVKTPEEVGLSPDGTFSAKAPKAPEPVTWTFRQALATRDVWLITLIVGPCNLGIASVLLSLPAYATDLGISEMRASSVVALTAVFGAIAKIVLGMLADRLNLKLVVALAVLFQVLGVVLLLLNTSYEGMLVAAVVFGFGYGGTAPLWAILLANQFGRESFPTIMGANMPMLMPFGLIALPLTNWIFEVQGSYHSAYVSLIGWYVLAALALALLPVRNQPRQQGQLA